MKNLGLAVAASVFAFNFAPVAGWSQPLPVAPVVLPTPGLGACFWGNVSDQKKKEFAEVYHQSMDANHHPVAKIFTDWMQENKPVLDDAFAKCDAHPKIPFMLRSAVIFSQFDLFGAASELAANVHITRDELDETWKNAPEMARQCERAQAGMAMGGTDLTCPDTKAIFWFTKDLESRHKLDHGRGDTLMIITYMSAKARTDIAEAKIAAFEAQVVPAS